MVLRATNMCDEKYTTVCLYRKTKPGRPVCSPCREYYIFTAQNMSAATSEGIFHFK